MAALRQPNGHEHPRMVSRTGPVKKRLKRSTVVDVVDLTGSDNDDETDDHQVAALQLARLANSSHKQSPAATLSSNDHSKSLVPPPEPILSGGPRHVVTLYPAGGDFNKLRAQQNVDGVLEKFLAPYFAASDKTSFVTSVLFKAVHVQGWEGSAREGRPCDLSTCEARDRIMQYFRDMKKRLGRPYIGHTSNNNNKKRPSRSEQSDWSFSVDNSGRMISEGCSVFFKTRPKGERPIVFLYPSREDTTGLKHHHLAPHLEKYVAFYQQTAPVYRTKFVELVVLRNLLFRVAKNHNSNFFVMPDRNEIIQGVETTLQLMRSKPRRHDWSGAESKVGRKVAVRNPDKAKAKAFTGRITGIVYKVELDIGKEVYVDEQACLLLSKSCT